eukprot:14765933-Alexandrium_andersonii.AAC.1
MKRPAEQLDLKAAFDLAKKARALLRSPWVRLARGAARHCSGCDVWVVGRSWKLSGCQVSSGLAGGLGTQCTHAAESH